MNTAYKRLPAYVLLAAAFVGVAGSYLVASLPAGHPGNQPPFALFLLVGVGVIALTAVVVALAVKLGLPLKQSTVGLVLAFNAIIVGVKFIAAPLGLYSSNLSGPGFTNTDPLVSGSGYWLIALPTFLLYVLVLSGLFRIISRRVAGQPRKKHSVWLIAAVIAVLAIALYAGASVVLLPLVVVAFPIIDYLSSTGPLLGVICIALVAAIFLAAVAVRSAARESNQLRDAGLLASLFWLCLSLILLYHVLWVIFMTALITVWPFKTFVPGGK